MPKIANSILCTAVAGIFFIQSVECSAAASCSAVPNSKTCIDATPCKTNSAGINVCLAGIATSGAYAVNTTATCWQYTYDYACSNPNGTSDTCVDLKNNPACGVISTSCESKVEETGICASIKYTYQCETAAATTTKTTSCTDGLFTANIPDGVNPNNNFGIAAAASEAIRQAQAYATLGNSIFSGVSETCTTGYFGLKNCCKTVQGAKSNGALAAGMSSVAFTTVKYYGAKAVDTVSPYVFDAMYSNGIWTNGMTQAFSVGASAIPGETLATFGTSAASSVGIGAYGVTFYPAISSMEALEAAVEAGDVLSGTIGIADTFGGVIAFNPYMLAGALVIKFVMSMMECSEEEQMLSMHKGASLSYYIKKECTSKFLGICLEYTSYYCSYNSVLAKLINTQGKPQLGEPIEGCAGFTATDLTKLDWKKIDLSEFTTQITNDALSNLPTSAAIKSSYTAPATTATNGTAQKSGSAVLPTY